MLDIEAFIEKVPIWIKWLLLIGGALMSAFASKFLDSIQTLGLNVGIFCAALGFLALIWHFVNEWRVHNERSRLKLEPQYLIVFGLVIAVIGTAWLIYRGPQIITVAAPQSSQVAPQPAAPSASLYTERDIRELLDATKDAKTLLDLKRPGFAGGSNS